MQERRPGTHRVLLVGHSPPIAAELTALLTEQDFWVQATVDGPTALEAIRQGAPDLILLDVDLVDGDGRAFCRRLKVDQATGDIPILSVLAQGDPRASSSVFAVGAADYVTTPLQEKEVLARVRTHLALKAMREQLAEGKAQREQKRLFQDERPEISEPGLAQEALQELARDLGKRIKELDCLYALSMLVEVPGITLQEIVQGTVVLVPDAYQYPEITCARITLDGQEFRTANWMETNWQQVRDIWVGDRRAGWVQVCYLEESADEDKGPFLDEEESLLSAVAQRLGRVAERMQAQEALRRSEERYALAQRAAHIGSWDWDIQGGDLHWSEQIEPMFGFGQGEFGATYEAFLDSVHPEDRARVVAAIDACVQEGADYEIEHRIVWPDGTVRWMAESGGVARDANGQAVQMYGLVQDVTARRQVDEQIRQQNVFLNSVIESLTHPFYVVRVDDYRVEMANSAAREGGVCGTDTCYALTHSRDEPCGGPAHICPILEIVRTKRPVIVEHVHNDAGGGARHVEVRGYPLFDDGGDVSRVISYTFDITQRKRAEEALQESEARWRSVTENSPDNVILLDDKLDIQFVNHASPGLTVEDLIGTPLWTLVSEESQLEVKGILSAVLETGQPQSYETEYSAPDGGSIYYESRAVARTLDGQAIGLTVNARDITEHKRIEQALREAKEAAEQARRQERERRQEADRRRRIAESLAGVLVALNSGWPLKQILDHIVGQANELLDTRAVTLYQVPGEAGDLVVQAAAGALSDVLGSDGRPLGVEALLQAADSRRAVSVSDLAAAPSLWSDAQDAPPFGAQLAVPIVIQDLVYGGIVLYYAHPRSFFEEELELAAVFADQVALAVENTRLRERVQEAAVAAERSRLARDLHDSVTQALFSASLVAEVLPQVWRRDPEEAWHGIEELRDLSRGALAEMRTLLLELRPTALVETKLHDLLAQLVEATTGRAQLLVELNVEPSPILPPTVHITFYRVAQEALHNVVKHAGASQVSVSLRASPPVSSQHIEDWQGELVLCVSDDGQGFDQGQVGPDQLGLSIMRERAEAMGGTLTLDSRPGRGTVVTLQWRDAPS